MNKEFIKLNGNTVVSSDNDELKIVPNYQNPEEVLKQENLVEMINKKIEELQEKKNNTKPSKFNFKKVLPFDLTLILMPLLIGGIIKFVFGFEPAMEVTKFGTISSPLYMSIWTTWICLCAKISNLTLGKFFDKRECKKKIEAYESSIEYLQNKKIEEERKLSSIKNKNRVEQEEKVIVGPIKIHDLEALKEIERFVHINYNGRLNLKKYYRDYLDGTLQFTLKKEGELNNLDNYLDFIEDNGPRLIKEFRTSDKY